MPRSVAIRLATVDPTGAAVPGGHAYAILDAGPVRVSDVIAEKVRAEIRKRRAGGETASSLRRLVPNAPEAATPAAEEQTINMACQAFIRGKFLLLIDGKVLGVGPEAVIELRRETSITFVVHTERAAPIEVAA